MLFQRNNALKVPLLSSKSTFTGSAEAKLGSVMRRHVRVIEAPAWLGDPELKDLRLVRWSQTEATCLKRTSVSVLYLCSCSPPCSTTTDCGINPSLVFSPVQSRRRFSANRAADTLRASLPSQQTPLRGQRGDSTGLDWKFSFRPALKCFFKWTEKPNERMLTLQSWIFLFFFCTSYMSLCTRSRFLLCNDVFC